MIYLDNAATTYPKSEKVYEAIDMANRRYGVNAGRGSYALAKAASNIIEETRRLILEHTHAKYVAEVVFTASATVACNQILGGMEWKQEDVVYVSPYEHNAIMRTLYHFQKQYQFCIVEIPLVEDGLEIDLDKLEAMFINNAPTYVCVTAISNVTGYILPVKEIIKRAKEYKAISIVDASQAVGLIPINMETLGADYVVFAGHKSLYGPFGVGGFLKRKGLMLKPYLVGGTGSDSLNLEVPVDTSARYEVGSFNVVAIAGLKAALEERMEDSRTLSEKKLAEELIYQLQEIPQVEMYVPKNLGCHIGIVSFNVRGYLAEDIGMILDQDYDIAVRTGYHCAPLIHKYLRNEEYLGTVRVSFGQFNTSADVQRVYESILEVV